MVPDQAQTESASAAMPLPNISAGEPTRRETCILALGALISAVAAIVFDSHAPIVIVLLVVALLPWALIAAGSRIPLWLFVAANVIPAVLIIVTHQAGAVIFLGVFTACRAGSVRGMRGAMIVGLIVVALPIIQEIAVDDFGEESGAPYFVIGIGIGALAGAQFHRQRELLAQLRWSNARLREAAAADERRRIARDIHDVLAHSLTVVVLNLTGARKALATHPELAEDALRRAEQTGRDSLDGVRRIVGLLRSEADEPGGAAAPTAAEVPSIVADQRQAGVDVALTVDGDLDGVDPLAGTTLARVVQETLTNAGRHAPGASVTVNVAVEKTAITVEIHNETAHHPSLDHHIERQGLGLVGMRERVEALGGTFTAGPDAGGWTVSCVLPLSATTSATTGSSSAPEGTS